MIPKHDTAGVAGYGLSSSLQGAIAAKGRAVVKSGLDLRSHLVYMRGLLQGLESPEMCP